MEEPKELTGLDYDNYDYPLTDVPRLSVKEKKGLAETRNAHTESVEFRRRV